MTKDAISEGGTSQYRVMLQGLGLIMLVVTITAVLRVSELGTASPLRMGAVGLLIAGGLFALAELPRWVKSRV